MKLWKQVVISVGISALILSGLVFAAASNNMNYAKRIGTVTVPSTNYFSKGDSTGWYPTTRDTNYVLEIAVDSACRMQVAATGIATLEPNQSLYVQVMCDTATVHLIYKDTLIVSGPSWGKGKTDVPFTYFTSLQRAAYGTKKDSLFLRFAVKSAASSPITVSNVKFHVSVAANGNTTAAQK